MAYDAELAERIRDLVSTYDGIEERRMFGGLAFLLHGNMAVAASNDGGLLVRVDPETGDALLDDGGVTPMVMRNREMRGWLRVAAPSLTSPEALGQWVARGLGFAGSLPAK